MFQKKKKRTHRGKTNFLPILTLFLVALLYFISTSYSEKWNFKWTGIRKNIKDSILALDKYGGLTGPAVGYSGRTPNQWYRQKWLLENATENELYELTDYPSGTVKGLAYSGLILKSSANKYDLYQKSLNDTLAFVYHTSGCIEAGFMLSEYTIDFIGRENIKDLSSEQRKKIMTLYSERLSKKEFYKEEYYKLLK